MIGDIVRVRYVASLTENGKVMTYCAPSSSYQRALYVPLSL